MPKEVAASDEVQPVSRASVSEESEEMTSDIGSQSAPEQPPRKKPKRRNAPADKRHALKHARQYREKQAHQAAFSTKFFMNGENSFDETMLRKCQ